MKPVVGFGQRIGSEDDQQDIDGNTDGHAQQGDAQGLPELGIFHHISVGGQVEPPGQNAHVAGNGFDLFGKGQCDHMHDRHKADDHQHGENDIVQQRKDGKAFTNHDSSSFLRIPDNQNAWWQCDRK